MHTNYNSYANNYLLHFSFCTYHRVHRAGFFTNGYRKENPNECKTRIKPREGASENI